ncbi:D-Tyr tRNAtyr deacylase-like domain-containing protein [Dipodascopsis uninucleata]
MRAVVQRVTSASVIVDGTITGEIKRGLLVLLGVEQGDTESDGEIMAKKIMNIKMFPASISTVMDSEYIESSLPKQWVRNVKDVDGGVLCVSQFTLMASVKKNKPSFHHAASPQVATSLYEQVLANLKAEYGPDKEDRIQAGVFQAYMQVQLINDGPVTFELSTK